MTEESKRSIDQIRKLNGSECVTNKRFIRTKEGTELYQMGKTKFMQIAREAGVLYKIDRSCLIEVEVFEDYLKSFKVPGVIK